MNRESLDRLSWTSTTLFNNLSLQRKIEQHGCSFYTPVYLARFSNSMQKFQLEKNVCMNNWKLRNEQTQQLKNVLFKNRYSSKQLFYRVSSWLMIRISEKYQWRIHFSKVAGLQPGILIRTEHFYKHNFICLAQIWNSYFVEHLPVGTSQWIKADILLNIRIKERCETHPVK